MFIIIYLDWYSNYAWNKLSSLSLNMLSIAQHGINDSVNGIID